MLCLSPPFAVLNMLPHTVRVKLTPCSDDLPTGVDKSDVHVVEHDQQLDWFLSSSLHLAHGCGWVGCGLV